MLRYFSSIEEIRATIEFPPKSAFYSKLKQEGVDDETYNNQKKLYDSRMALPQGDENKWNNFSNFLEYYKVILGFTQILSH